MVDFQFTVNVKVYQRETLRMVYPHLSEMFDPETDIPECIIKADVNFLGNPVVEWQPETSQALLPLAQKVTDDMFDLARDILQNGAASCLLKKAASAFRKELKAELKLRGADWTAGFILEKGVIPSQKAPAYEKYNLMPDAQQDNGKKSA